MQKRNTAYQRRTSKLSTRQKSLLSQSHFLLSIDDHETLQRFIADKDTYCEIGFGKGDHLLKQAKTYPSNHYLGIDLYKQGISKVLGEIENTNLSNIRLLEADATEIFEAQIPTHTLKHIDILHPDPWPKKRHHKRRLITSGFLKLLMTRLQPNGTCRIISDDASYTEWIHEILCSSHISFTVEENCAPITKYGKKAVLVGNNITTYILKS